MKTTSLCLVALILCAQTTLARRQQEPPREWIDPDTGHRVVRLSQEPGSESLYFHQNAYTTEGDKLIITTPTGVSTINLKTREIEKVVDGRVNVIPFLPNFVAGPPVTAKCRCGRQRTARTGRASISTCAAS